MTIHKLTRPGQRRTVCNLTVPKLVDIASTAVVWEDGAADGPPNCDEGCFASDGAVEPHPSAPGAPPSPFQRYDVMARKAHGTDRVQIGTAVQNRDRSIAVHIESIPVDGKIVLVPR